MSFTASALIVSWAAIGLLAFALAGVLARVHRLEQQLAGEAIEPSPVGQPLPLPDLQGGPFLVLFVDDGCGSCEQAAEGVAELEERGRARVVWRQDDPDAFAAAGVTATPHAVVVDEDLRVVTSIPVGSAERLTEAVRTVDELADLAP